MATVRNVGPNFTINASNVYVIGDASDEQQNGGFLVQIVDDSSYSGTVTVEGQSWVARLQGLADNFVGIPYRKLYLNGSAGDGSFVTTGITTNSVVFIPACGMEIALSVAYTSGAAHALVIPVLGAASI